MFLFWSLVAINCAVLIALLLVLCNQQKEFADGIILVFIVLS